MKAHSAMAPWIHDVLKDPNGAESADYFDKTWSLDSIGISNPLEIDRARFEEQLQDSTSFKPRIDTDLQVLKIELNKEYGSAS